MQTCNWSPLANMSPCTFESVILNDTAIDAATCKLLLPIITLNWGRHIANMNESVKTLQVSSQYKMDILINHYFFQHINLHIKRHSSSKKWQTILCNLIISQILIGQNKITFKTFKPYRLKKSSI